ncbi:viral A-type inclusion protein [Reticulomyxa filosa]|uniref:Viral A-type inclusion protein n=1 Tax=Reticulomyxa filosa TaxID=46433 RepID=X6N9U7_RETFI|nr:viral A-type inclusion protein [Reticulomyxa filosa]|eukprot:ETO22077.1 viral A-type inclusion protein [Reticulomyxa filosa]
MSHKPEKFRKSSRTQSQVFKHVIDARLKFLSKEVISYLSTSHLDETIQILSKSEETQKFVVERIIEIIQEKLQNEKESTILQLVEENQLLIHSIQQYKNQESSIINLKNDKKQIEAALKTTQTSHNELEKHLQQTERGLQEKTKITKEMGSYKYEMESCKKQLEALKAKVMEGHGDFDTLKSINETLKAENIMMEKELNSTKEELEKKKELIEKLNYSLMISETERLTLKDSYKELSGNVHQIKETQQNQVQEINPFTSFASQLRHLQSEEVTNVKIKELHQQCEDQAKEIDLLTNKLKTTMEDSHALRVFFIVCASFTQKILKNSQLEKEVSKTGNLTNKNHELYEQLKLEQELNQKYSNEMEQLRNTLYVSFIANYFYHYMFYFDHVKNAIDTTKSEAIQKQFIDLKKYYQSLVDQNISQLKEEFEVFLWENTRTLFIFSTFLDLRMKDVKEEYEETLASIHTAAEEKLADTQKEMSTELEMTTQELKSAKEANYKYEHLTAEFEKQLEEIVASNAALMEDLNHKQTEIEVLRQI